MTNATVRQFCIKVGVWECCKTLVTSRACPATVLRAVVLAYVAQVKGFAAEPDKNKPMQRACNSLCGNCNSIASAVREPPIDVIHKLWLQQSVATWQ